MMTIIIKINKIVIMVDDDQSDLKPFVINCHFIIIMIENCVNDAVTASAQ